MPQTIVEAADASPAHGSGVRSPILHQRGQVLKLPPSRSPDRLAATIAKLCEGAADCALLAPQCPPANNAAFPPAAAVLIVSVCSAAKR